MPISYRQQGSIFDSGAQVLVNPVNCVGVMGKGLALEFKKRYPANFEAYRTCCRNGELTSGGVFAYADASGIVILNTATKHHWSNPSTLQDVIYCLNNIWIFIDESKPKYTSIALPALGCGLGGLSWDDVKSKIDIVFKSVDANVIVFYPS